MTLPTPKFLFAFLLISIVSVPQTWVFGQSYTWIGIEAGPKWEYFRHIDPGVSLSQRSLMAAPNLGVTLSHQFNSPWCLETGLMRYNYFESHTVKGLAGGSAVQTHQVMSIPIRIRYEMNLFPERMRMYPHIGLNLAWYTPQAGTRTFSSRSGPRVGQDPPQVEATFSQETFARQGAFLVEAGLNLEYHFEWGLGITVGFRHHKGYKPIVKTNVDYTADGQGPYTAERTSYGSFYEVVAGLRYDVGRLWK